MKQLIIFLLLLILFAAVLAFYMGHPFQSDTIPAGKQPLPVTEALHTLNQQTQQAEPQPAPYPQISSQKEEAQPYIQPSTENKITIKYFNRPDHDNIKYLELTANDQPIETIFDTGASYIVFNTQTIQKLGINAFSARGISNTPAGDTYSYPFLLRSLKIGQVELRDVQCLYVPTSKDNLLGGSFLRNFIYSIDEDSQLITLIPRGQNIQYTDRGIEPVPSDGYAEIDGIRYIYNNGKLKKE